jgi:inner membrane transporter RhtA
MPITADPNADCGRPRVDAVSWTTGSGCEACPVSRSDVVPAPVLVLGAIASVQSGAAVATKLFSAVGPGGAVFLRLAVSAVLLVAIVRPRLRGISRPDLILVVGFGLVLALMNCLFYLSIARIPLGVAVTVEFLGPLGVAVAGSRRWLDAVWVVLAAAGVALLASGGGSLDIVGVVLAASAGVCWAAYILLSQRVGRAFDGMTGLAIALTVGAVAMVPYGVWAGGSALLRPSVLGEGAAIAVLSSAIPYSLELVALRRLRAAVFGVLMSLEPAFGALSGLLFLGQRLRWHEWIAVAAVMAASIGATGQPKVGAAIEAEPVDVLG